MDFKLEQVEGSLLLMVESGNRGVGTRSGLSKH